MAGYLTAAVSLKHKQASVNHLSLVLMGREKKKKNRNLLKMLSLVGYMSMTGNNPYEEGNNLAACGLEMLPRPRCHTFGVSVLPTYCALHLSHVSVAGTRERGIPLSTKS